MADELEIKEVGDAPHLREFIPALTSGGYFHSAWKTPESFARHIEQIDRSKEWTDSGWEGGKNWHGTDTMEEALNMAKYGWTEGVDQVFRLRDRVIASNPLRLAPVKYGIAGTVPSVPRAVAGNIMNMKAHDLSRTKKRSVITLVANMTASCMVDAEKITNRAAVVAALVDQMEASGYAVEVISTALTEGKRGHHSATSVIVKEAGQPVDTGRLAYALGHSSFFRRLIFASWGSDKFNEDRLGYGLGHCIEPDPSKLPDKNIFVLPSAGYKSKLFKDEATAETEGLKMLMEHLAKQKCPAFKHIPITDEEKDDEDYPEPDYDYDDEDDF